MPPPEPARPLDDLLAAASSREAWFPEDTKSGARFERVVIDGERYVLKYQDRRDDWLMRATGDLGYRYIRVCEHVLERLPDVIDPAVVACGHDGSAGMILLRDVSDWLIADTSPFPDEVHAEFLDHMAAMHAAMWGWRDDIGLCSAEARYLAFSPSVARAEAAAGSAAIVPKVMADGWARLPGASAPLARVVQPLLEDVGPLVAALGHVPHTFVHGDWKAANLGRHADGRTVLLDFGEVPGEASPLADLSWYLALNSALLPESKDDTIVRYRAALERHGIDTAGWWDAAVGLEMLGAMVQFGWEKALGGGPELEWWEARAVEGTRWL